MPSWLICSLSAAPRELLLPIQNSAPEKPMRPESYSNSALSLRICVPGSSKRTLPVRYSDRVSGS